MKEPLPTTLSQLWELADGNPLDAASDWNDVFDPVGLILYAPPRYGGYWCTPINTVAFATTGGDGVHYSFLTDNGAYTDFSPIIMTVPMCDTPNVVVGANLREFLALGCRYGYFALEQLIYHPADTLAELDTKRFDSEYTAAERSLLNRISSRFKVEPWSDPKSRLAELKNLYDKSLVLPPQDEHAA